MTKSEGWRYEAALRVFSKNLTPSEISNILAASPTNSCLMGSPMSTRNPSSAKHTHHFWLLESNTKDDTGFNEVLEPIVSFLETHSQEIQSLSESCLIDVFCGVFPDTGQGTILLNAEMTRRLSKFSVDFVLDLYPFPAKQRL